MTLDKIKSYGSMTLKGLLTTNAPSMVQGMLVEVLSRKVKYKGRERNIDVKLVCQLVDGNESLWSLFPLAWHSRTSQGLSNLGNMDWFTADWAISAIKKDHPALASLFLSWRKAHQWLVKQIQEIKMEAKQ